MLTNSQYNFQNTYGIEDCVIFTKKRLLYEDLI